MKTHSKLKARAARISVVAVAAAGLTGAMVPAAATAAPKSSAKTETTKTVTKTVDSVYSGTGRKVG